MSAPHPISTPGAPPRARRHPATLMQAGPDGAAVTVDAYVDMVCPFCAKLVAPLLAVQAKNASAMAVRFVLLVQPWHAQGATLARAVASFAMVCPDKGVEFLQRVMARKGDFTDDAMWDKSPAAIADMLEATVRELGADADAWRATLKSPISRKSIVLHTKLARQNGAHVSPTVAVNGIVESQPSSGWSEDEWAEYLQQFLA